MKKILYLAGIACLTVTSGCSRAKRLADINVDIPYNKQFSIPAAAAGYPAGTPLPPGGITLPLPAVPVPTNSQQYIAQYNTSIEKIVSVDLKKMTLQILSPANQNFNYLDTVRLYISSPNLPEMMVAYAYNIPKNVSELDLYTITDVNLKTYFVQDTMYFRMTTHINALPPSGEELNLMTVFHMLANPLL